MSVTSKPTKRLKRRRRVRAKVRGTAERPRLSVFRSNKGLFVQLIDDVDGRTVAAVNWTESEFRSLVANMVQGVTDGFEKRLEIQGVGYRAALKGKDLELSVGYSHPVTIQAPAGIEFEVPQPTRIAVRGSSKQAVGEVAARIRKVRPPEPYKGKGIRYEGEYVQRKVGKRA